MIDLRRWGKRLGFAVALLLLTWLAAWLGGPPLLKWQIEKQGSALLGRELRVGAVKLEPWRLALTLDGVSMGAAAEAADRRPQAEIARIAVDLDAASLWRRAPVVESLRVEGPKLRLARLAEGRYDIDDLLRRFAPDPAAPAGEPARFALYNLELVDGDLRLDDRPVAREHRIAELRLALPFLSNLPDDLQVKVQPHLSFVFDGSRFDSGASATPFAERRAGDLRLRIDGFQLAPWQPYLPADLPFKPLKGRVDAELAIGFEQPPKAVPKLVLKGQASLSEVEVAGPATAAPAAAAPPALAWRSLKLGLADLQPLQRRLEFEALEIDGLVLRARRLADGRIDLQPPPSRPAAAATAASAPAAEAASSGWQVGLRRLQLADARIDWADASTRPAAALGMRGLRLSLEGLRWPAREPAKLQAAAELVAADQPAGTLALEGEGSPSRARLALKAEALRLEAAAPYLAEVLAARLGGEAALEATLDWQAAEGGTAARTRVTVPALTVAELKLSEPGAKVPVAGWKRLQVDDLALDLEARQLTLGRLGLAQPQVALARDAGGRFSAERWLVPERPAAGKPARPGTAPAKASAAGTEAPWRLALRELRIDGGKASFDDAGTGRGPVALSLDGLQLQAGPLAWPLAAKPAPVKLQLAAKLLDRHAGAASPPARLDWRGSLTPAPLAAEGRLSLERFPVHALEPYFGARLPVTLLRAEAGWKGELAVRDSAAGWTVSARGDALLADLHIGPPAGTSGDELLAWQSLSLQGVQVALAPAGVPKVEIAEAALSDFFARLLVTEQGRFNLQDMAPAAPAGAASAPAGTGTGTAPVPAPAPAPAAPPSGAAAPAAPGASVVAAAPAARSLDLTVGRTRLSNGRVDFNDRFIRPNYSAALSELNGSLGRFQSGSSAMAPLELRGRAAGTALLEIVGELNPTADPLALDIRAKATDLELAPLSPYAGKYAGYAIERGKLSMEVAYKIQPDGKLDARNQVILNQLTFGDKVDSPDATKLPVLLAVALLKDRNGVIDIDLPISGSINDPQFSVFGLVLKVIGNLLVKAITAPFSLLAGGGGEDLSFAEFRPGTAELSDKGLAVIDKVAKSLTDRPALKMTVTGASDPVAEREAMQAAALEARLRAEQRRERLRAGASGESASAPLQPAERAALLKQLYGDTKLPDKPRNLVGLAKDLPPDEMESRLKAAQLVTTDSARELALQRGLAVRDALVAKGLPAERLFLAAPKLRASGEEDANWTPRVQLSLSTQ